MERRTFLGFTPFTAGLLLVDQNRRQEGIPGLGLDQDTERVRFKKVYDEGMFWHQLEFPSPKTLPLLRKAWELSPGVATTKEMADIRHALYHVERQDTESREKINEWDRSPTWNLASDQLGRLGFDLLYRGRFPEAFEAFRHAKEALPLFKGANYEHCWVGMAHVRYCQGRHVEGLELLEQYALEINHDLTFPFIPFYRILFLCALCRKEQALVEARKFAQAWGSFVEALAPALSRIGIDAYLIHIETLKSL